MVTIKPDLAGYWDEINIYICIYTCHLIIIPCFDTDQRGFLITFFEYVSY